MPEEETTKELLAKANEAASELQHAISNYKKSPKDRLSETYIKNYKEKIENLWLQFQKLDRLVRNVIPDTHRYFEQDPYRALGSKFSEVVDLMSLQLASLKEESMNAATSRAATSGAGTSAEASIPPPFPPPEHTRQLKLIDNIKALINQALKATNQSMQYYELTLQNIEQHWKNVQMLHEKLLSSPGNYDLDQFLSNEQYITEAILRLRELVHSSSMQPSPNSSSAESSKVKLPAVELPKFDGNSLKWRQFRDLFLELVHSQDLPKCQKLWYLKTSLKGEAEQLIKHLSATAENYDAAWQILEERFENRRMLVNAILSRLINQSAIQSDNACSIKGLHDTTQECLFSLKNLSININDWDPIVLYILIQKLNKNLHAQWENSLTNPRELPNVCDFLKFLNVRFQSLESLNFRQGKATSDHERKVPYQSFSVITKGSSCIMCKQDHALYKCPDFLKLTPPYRLNLVQRANCCVNCLKRGHKPRNCSSSSCLKCQKKHNTLLHLESSQSQPHSGHQGTQNHVPPVTLTTISKKEPQVRTLLSTVSLLVKNNRGEKVKCRALLDSGSQINLITTTLVNQLGFHKNASSLEIVGIGNSKRHTSGRVNINLSSISTNFNCNIEAHILPSIVSTQPVRKINIEGWNIPRNIKLADPDFAEPGNIDLLVGAGMFYRIFSVGQISLGNSLPTLQNSVFGWLLGGEYLQTPEYSPTICGVLTEDNSLEERLEQFWKLEECEQRQNTLTTAEQKCETHFIQNVRRSGDGRYVVSLPFTHSSCELGDSKDIALQRFRSVERKLRSDPAFKAEYVKFMKEYEGLGHMSQISLASLEHPHYFLPHHAVLKPDSSTTKLRVVFDASAKTSTNISLNDILSKGPTIQDDVFSILIRFRLPLYAMTADVEKMYRQIWVNENDRNLQLIWWRDNENEQLKCYQLNTVTYGTSAAPYLAIRTLRAMADDMGAKYPLAAMAIRNHFYVDDVLCGSDNLFEALEIQKQLLLVFQSAGMNLRKWVANHPRLLDAVPPADRESSLDLDNNRNHDVKTMGLRWEPKNDMFRLRLGGFSSKAITKRSILSDIAQLFDPLGFIAPVTAAAKILLQKIWKLKLDWDAALPQELHQTWAQFRNEIQSLQQVAVPRYVFGNKPGLSSETHIFCDASEQAYGAVAYIRTTQPHNVVSIRFLCAKSKVAPVKQVSLPRLELCAAKLGAELFQKLRETEYFQSTKVYFWTDSTAVLGWIKAESANYHTFIANRIAAIQRISPSSNWRHVRSEDNPADLISRGLSPSQLINNQFWFYGPRFLHGSISCWPLQPPGGPCELELRKPEKTLIATTIESNDVLDSINHRNSFHTLKRVVAVLLRFARRSRGRVELEDAAQKIIIKNMQSEYFKEEISHSKKHGAVKNTSPISSLTPFLDKDGILRVGGRLEASNLSFNAKHPILLPNQHKFTRLLLETVHRDNLHAGPQTLMSIIRQNFWPLKLKMISRAVVQNCVKCARAKPKLMNQLMGNLPADRVHPARPFVISGVDFFGPVWTHFRIRGKRPLKSYVAVFCCFSTKAVHMELVSDLTTEAFLAALKRFVARRGHCQKLYCDNATNFVGARNYIEELYDSIHTEAAQEKIQSECSKKCIEFSFIPPRSPHFGGLWEAAVKSAKKLLLSTLSSAALTYEEMTTVITEAEAILNSRPITPMSSNPNDLQALTPGHFLIGEPLVSSIYDTSQPNTTKNLDRWKLINQLKAEFWHRWFNEYLSTMQYRTKWQQENHKIEPGTMVIIKEDNLPCMRWPLGRIERVIPGSDGLVRVADVRTATTVARRPIHRLAPLPVEDQEIPQSVDETSHASQSPKRRKLATPSLLTTFLVICLILPLCLANSIDIQPFATRPGLFFEKIGTAGIAASEWTLISYVDMKSYWQKYDHMIRYPSALRKISSTKQHETIINLAEELLDEIRMKNALLSPYSYKRSKRGAINIIGNVANSLFGILDSNYAEKAERDIEKIKQNEGYLVEQLQNQTTFIDATATIMKTTEKEVMNNLRRITSQLHNLEDNVVKSEAFSELAIQAIFDMTQFERLQDSLSDVLVESHHGKISPRLLPPAQLKNELEGIKVNLPINLRLPASTEKLLNFYKLIKIEGRARENYIIFKLTLDLLNNEEFEVLKISKVPWLIKQDFYQIQSHLELLVINLHRDRYLPIKETEAGICNLIDEDYFICHQHHPLYKIGAAVGICEVQLLNHQPSSSCEIERTNSGPHWIQLKDPNTWIYSVTTNYTVNAVCGSTPTQIVLHNSGILHLRPDCNIKQSGITIQGYQRLETKLPTFYFPNHNIETLINVTHRVAQDTYMTSSMAEIDNLKENLSKLRINLPREVTPHDIHHYTMVYLCIAIIIIGVCILYYHYNGTWTTKKGEPPTPAPRRISTNAIDVADEEFITISG